MVSEYALLLVTEALSVTVMLTLNGLPVAVVGVPESTPVLVFKLRPVGKPDDDHVKGLLPPVAVTVVEGYATPTVPVGSVAGPLTAGTGLMVTEYVLLLVTEARSVTVMLTL